MSSAAAEIARVVYYKLYIAKNYRFPGLHFCC